MTSKHTPGPWELEDNDESPFITIYANGDEIALADVSLEDVSLEEARANAALMAAAPDLLKACELVLPILKNMPEPKLGEWNWPFLASELKAAVAKATE